MRARVMGRGVISAVQRLSSLSCSLREPRWLCGDGGAIPHGLKLLLRYISPATKIHVKVLLPIAGDCC